MVLLLLLTAFAQTLQRQQSGPTLELGAGPALVGPPARFAIAGQLTAGWWFGKYDDSYGLGRFTALVAHQELTWTTSNGAFRYTPMLEFRRGMDLFVVAPHYLIAVGPVFAPGTQVGLGARVGGGLKLRRSRRMGFVGRLAGGVDWVEGRFAPAVTLTLGAGYSTPVQTIRR